MKIEVDRKSRVEHYGLYKGIRWSISAFRFNDEPDSWDQHEACATYIHLSEETHEQYKSKLNDLPWNGGQTYYRKITEEHIDAPPELADKVNKPFYKIGDDFQHIWDREQGFRYDRLLLESHIKRVIDALVGDE